MTRFKIWHPSGENRELTGSLHLMASQQGHQMAIALQISHQVTSSVLGSPTDQWVPGALCFIDPLCVVVETNSGKVCYSPRRPLDGKLLTESARKWLDDNPAWPNVLELDLENAWTKEDWG